MIVDDDNAHSVEQALEGPGLPFTIDNETYWVRYDSRLVAYTIVLDGRTINFASSVHHGNIGAFCIIADCLRYMEHVAERKS